MMNKINVDLSNVDVIILTFERILYTILIHHSKKLIRLATRWR